MGVAELDALVNRASVETFGEPVTFRVGGRDVPARAVFELRPDEAELGAAPLDSLLPSLLMPIAALRATGARNGDMVTVRGVRYTLIDGMDDPVTDAGGMARIQLRAYTS